MALVENTLTSATSGSTVAVKRVMIGVNAKRVHAYLQLLLIKNLLGHFTRDERAGLVVELDFRSRRPTAAL